MMFAEIAKGHGNEGRARRGGGPGPGKLPRRRAGHRMQRGETEAKDRTETGAGTGENEDRTQQHTTHGYGRNRRSAPSAPHNRPRDRRSLLSYRRDGFRRVGLAAMEVPLGCDRR